MELLKDYQRAALQLAEVKSLGPGEGYSARIPGFSGLIVFGESRKKVMSELASALEGWIDLSLVRGNGLPSVCSSSDPVATSR